MSVEHASLTRRPFRPEEGGERSVGQVEALGGKQERSELATVETTSLARVDLGASDGAGRRSCVTRAGGATWVWWRLVGIVVKVHGMGASGETSSRREGPNVEKLELPSGRGALTRQRPNDGQALTVTV